ncbi:uncharacterized protein LOC126847984 isoform X1 [Adelges cooleyi]|uniref:uncharacterized protein LOC126847984 isoform X1 n=1 Tax=Adelges cooleyi TaxID=133065 RepID=UPI00217FC36D|nr:uncharacterized protein LOC126847984 isoform X1 [Adelges cooleyi]
MATAGDQNKESAFVLVLYHFRVQPKATGPTYALQQPFATLWDNLITVLWSVYGKGSKIQIGINQLQWALEFMKCMKIDYGYPESIEKIVNELEDRLISLYAKVGQKLAENNERKKTEEEKAQNEKSETDAANADESSKITSYNEKDIISKLEGLKLPLDPETGEIKYLTTLNSLGKRKSMADDCPNDKKDSKNSLNKDYMIGALKKVLTKPADDAKNEVEELIKQLEVKSSGKPK